MYTQYQSVPAQMMKPGYVLYLPHIPKLLIRCHWAGINGHPIHCHLRNGAFGHPVALIEIKRCVASDAVEVYFVIMSSKLLGVSKAVASSDVYSLNDKYLERWIWLRWEDPPRPKTKSTRFHVPCVYMTTFDTENTLELQMFSDGTPMMKSEAFTKLLQQVGWSEQLLHADPVRPPRMNPSEYPSLSSEGTPARCDLSSSRGSMTRSRRQANTTKRTKNTNQTESVIGNLDVSN